MKRYCCDGRCPPCVDRTRSRLLRALDRLQCGIEGHNPWPGWTKRDGYIWRCMDCGLTWKV